MGLTLFVKGVVPKKQCLIGVLEGEEIIIPIESLDSKFTLDLPLNYLQKLSQVQAESGLSRDEVFLHLIDAYLLESPFEIQTIRKNLSKRLKRGIDSAFITQLKLLYTFLGHFLKKIRVI